MDDLLSNRVHDWSEVLNGENKCTRSAVAGGTLTRGCAYRFSWRSNRANTRACWMRLLSGKRGSYPIAQPSANSWSGLIPASAVRVSTTIRGVASKESKHKPTSAASLITRSSRFMISSHSARSSTEICGWTPFGSFSRVSTAQSWPCSDTIALYAVLRAQSIGVSFRRRPAISTPTISSTYPVTASTNWAGVGQ